MANIKLTPGGPASPPQTDPTAIVDSTGLPVGKYTFSLVVTDDAGIASDPGTWAVEIRDKPVAKIDGVTTVALNQPINLTGKASTPAGSIKSFTWSLKG